jgi:hypothetical protein
LIDMPPSALGAPAAVDLPRAECVAAVKRHYKVVVATPDLACVSAWADGFWVKYVGYCGNLTVENASLTRGSSRVFQQKSLWLKAGPLAMPARASHDLLRLPKDSIMFRV